MLNTHTKRKLDAAIQKALQGEHEVLVAETQLEYNDYLVALSSDPRVSKQHGNEFVIPPGRVGLALAPL